MRPEVRDRLLGINRAFYQSLALPFASTRRRMQPGVRRLVQRIEAGESVLDVGCGHGLVAQELARLGHHGAYRGLDVSEPLIDLARRRLAAAWAQFVVADIAHPEGLAAAQGSPFDWILALAVLHHIPGAALRQEVATAMASGVRAGGQVAVSVWDFAESERFRRRAVAWESVGLSAADVEAGDWLIDWRHGGRGVRYVHQLTSETLADLAASAGLSVVEEYRSDGEGGRLGLYQVWRK